MAGVTGLIIAIGVTADSFIVYFERVRDELREGRNLRAAVEAGWARAKRTILVADGVNFIAAIVLYVLASSGVRGFAFTLGLTAIADLMVVFLFTHPVMVLLARTRYFGSGAKNSGLDPEALDAVPLYRGAGRIRTPEDSDGLTIAERRRRAAQQSSGTETAAHPVTDGAASASGAGSGTGAGAPTADAASPTEDTDRAGSSAVRTDPQEDQR